jgi:hypothetical protein
MWSSQWSIGQVTDFFSFEGRSGPLSFSLPKAFCDELCRRRVWFGPYVDCPEQHNGVEERFFNLFLCDGKNKTYLTLFTYLRLSPATHGYASLAGPNVQKNSLPHTSPRGDIPDSIQPDIRTHWCEIPAQTRARTLNASVLSGGD